MVVRVDWLLGSHLSTKDLNGSIRDDLVGVHVRLSSGTSLPYHEREVIDQLEVRNLLSRLLYSLADLWI